RRSSCETFDADTFRSKSLGGGALSPIKVNVFLVEEGVHAAWSSLSARFCEDLAMHDLRL
ncbi:unnamed protein product, partial [Durusdinium trenchii]